MSAAMTLDITQIAAVRGMLDQLAGADTAELMERIGIVAENAISDNFEGEHDPDGVSWVPSFRAKNEGGKTLTDHAILANSIDGSATATSVERGSNLIYARIHNEGGTIKGNPNLKFNIPGLGFRNVDSVTMPKRQFVGWGRESLADAEAETEDWLTSLLQPGAVS
jgi:phage gpG-like protein